MTNRARIGVMLMIVAAKGLLAAPLLGWAKSGPDDRPRRLGTRGMLLYDSASPGGFGGTGAPLPMSSESRRPPGSRKLRDDLPGDE